MVRIALDIDGTLGYRNRQQYLKTCNETLQLAIAEKQLQGISLDAFAHLPEVQAYRERVGEAHYNKAVGWIDYHPDVLRAMHPLPGAKEGVCLLGSVGSVAYYTARYTPQSEERSQAMARATLEWLATHDFVNPTSVVFCDGLPGKLWQLAQELARDPEPVILIDDQCARLLQRLADLDELLQLVTRSLILVAYGARSVPACAPLPVVALPSWDVEAVHHLLETIAQILAKEWEVKTSSVISD